MKIAMIAPHSLICRDVRISEDDGINDFVKKRNSQGEDFSPSDSILLLAALTPQKHEIVYMDDQYDNIRVSDDFDLAAITTMTVSANRAYDIADGFRRSGVHVVMGGVHPTLCPDDAAGHADTVVVGDADDVWGEFLDDLAEGSPKSRYHGGRADLSKRPPPRLSIAPREWYFWKTLQREVYPIYTTSGCTRICKFCSNWAKPGYGRLQLKSLSQIRSELDRIAEYSDNYELRIMDDNLFLDVDHGKKVVELLKEYGCGWMAPTDISVADHPRLLRIMKGSGCRILSLGLESINADNLTWLAPWKATQVKGYKENIAKLCDSGINSMGFFMVALEHDMQSVFEEIFRFFTESDLLTAGISILTPYPGTIVRDKLAGDGMLDTKAPWGDYTAYNMLFSHPSLSKRDVYDGFLRYLKRCESAEAIEHRKRLLAT